MPGWVEDLLKEMFYGPFYQLAKVVWDWCIGLSTGVISQDPQHFSPATWKFVTDFVKYRNMQGSRICRHMS